MKCETVPVQCARSSALFADGTLFVGRLLTCALLGAPCRPVNLIERPSWPMRRQRRTVGYCTDAHAPLFTRNLVRRASLVNVVCPGIKSSVWARSDAATITQSELYDIDFIQGHLLQQHPYFANTLAVGNRLL